MLKASPLEASSTVELTMDAKNSTAPAASMQRLLAALSEAIERSFGRHFIFNCGDLASLRSLAIWILLIGGFGVGILSMPLEAFMVHHDWINRLRVWFGVRSQSAGSACFVSGQVLFFPENNHFSMLSRS
jgi:hypothetical protein